MPVESVYGQQIGGGQCIFGTTNSSALRRCGNSVELFSDFAEQLSSLCIEGASVSCGLQQTTTNNKLQNNYKTTTSNNKSMRRRYY